MKEGQTTEINFILGVRETYRKRAAVRGLTSKYSEYVLFAIGSSALSPGRWKYLIIRWTAEGKHLQGTVSKVTLNIRQASMLRDICQIRSGRE